MSPPAVVAQSGELVLSEDQRRRFDEDGLLHVRGALAPAVLEQLRNAVDEVYAHERAAGRVDPHGSLHLLGFLNRHPAFLDLLDLPATFPLVWGLLGWNIYVYHSHLDVRPPVPTTSTAWAWHQDGGRQNLEVETDPRPRLSIKVVYWLSDVDEPGCGNTLVVPRQPPQQHAGPPRQRIDASARGRIWTRPAD